MDASLSASSVGCDERIPPGSVPDPSSITFFQSLNMLFVALLLVLYKTEENKQDFWSQKESVCYIYFAV